MGNETKRIITNVYVFPNGMVMVFDQHGKQMPDYQGRSDEVIPRIRAAGFTGKIVDSEWW